MRGSAKERVKPDINKIKRVGPRIIAMTLSHARLLAIGFVGLILGSAINLYFPYYVRGILNQQTDGPGLQEHLWPTVVVLLVLFFIQALFFFIRHFCFQAVGHRVIARLRELLYQALLRQDVDFFDRSRIGDLLSRLVGDTQLVQRAVTINISVVLRYAIQITGGVLLMVFLSPRLTLIICLVIPLFVFSSFLWGKKLRRLSRAMQDETAEANVVAEEALTAVRTVRMFAGEHHEQARFEGQNRRALETGIRRSLVAAMFSSSMVYFLNAAIAIVLGYGGSLVMSGDMPLGDLTAFLLYCTMVAVSFGFLVSAWDEFLQAVGGAERIFEIIDSEPKIFSGDVCESVPVQNAYDISFDNVTFAYPSRESQLALRQVSFVLPAAKTTALVGPSGAGKSTVAALIPRFYDPSHGIIRLAGIPLKKIQLGELRSLISMVEQQPRIFSVSIAENIRYGRLDASETEVIDAAKTANLHEFIIGLPHGYNTLVGDKGVQLSGGERQRLAIARAVLKNPRILILDEATSALDSQNEKLVQQALERIMKGRTTLVIAHRLSTVQGADQVLVLQNGAIIQEGTHGELVKSEGLYRSLVEHQVLA